MFCPTCGKDNSTDQRFCAACGTNLEAVSLALSGREEDFFTKFDVGMDQFIARYTDHVFKNASSGVSERGIARSWRLLGQAVVTTFVDLLLFTLMWNVLPLRFLILLISTPFRLLSERNRQHSDEQREILKDYEPPEVPGSQVQLWLAESTISVTEGTTHDLSAAKKSAAPTTDRLS